MNYRFTGTCPILSILLLLIFSGCSSLFTISGDSQTSLKEGRVVFNSNLDHSSARIEFPSLSYKDSSPLLLYISAKLKDSCIPSNNENQGKDLTNSSCVFSLKDIKAMGDGTVKVLTARDVRFSSLNFSSILPSFSIAVPSFYSGYSGIGFYNPFLPFSGFLLARDDYRYYNEAEYSRREVVARYIKPSSLTPDSFLGGFVALDFNNLSRTRPNDFIIQVKVKDELHTFRISLTSGKLKQQNN